MNCELNEREKKGKETKNKMKKKLNDDNNNREEEKKIAHTRMERMARTEHTHTNRELLD